MPTSPGWKRLGHRITQRRVEGGMPSQRALADRTGLSERVIGKAEQGHSVSRSTLARIELALGWAPGSTADILNGGEATETTPADDRPPIVAENWDDEYVRRLWGWKLTAEQRIRLITAYLGGRDPLVAVARFTEEQSESLRNAPAAYKALLDRKRDDDDRKNGPESGDRPA